MNFTEYLYHLAHAVFKRNDQNDSDVDKFAQAMGPNYDDAMEAIFLVREQALVATATGKALDALGKDRKMLRQPNEDDDIYRGRLLSAYRIYSSDGTAAGIIDMLKMIGYPDSEINELFKQGMVVPVFDGSHNYNGSSAHRGGIRWSEFTIKLGIAEDRSFTSADKELIHKTVSMGKPAHTKLVELILGMNFKDALPNNDYMENTLALAAADSFIRAGFRHNSQVVFGAVLQHNRRFLHGGQSLYNRLIPGAVNRHICIDEAADTAAVLTIQDEVKVFAPHQGWARNNLKYGGAIAQGRVIADALVKLDDVYQEIQEAAIVKPVIRFADAYIERQPHGIAVHPTRKGELFYSGAWLHEKRRPRSGSQAYGDHPARLAGPRRDGRHRYGILPGDRVDVYSTKVSMTDQPMAIFNDRSGHAFYRDRIPHGSGRMAVDVNTNKLGLTQSDVFALPGDALPGIGMDLSINDRAALTYSRAQRVPHNGGFIHGQAPFNLVKAAASLVLNDNCKGCSLYGGLEVPALHNGGGLRWKHQGNLLRLPFARHAAQWPRDGSKRYLEARARYSDRAAMYDGMEFHGRQRGLHDGSQTRIPGSMPEHMTITVRRGYRRIAI